MNRKFFKKLTQNDFVIQKEYRDRGKIICIDFQNKWFASNMLLTNPIVSFCDIRSCDLDIAETRDCDHLACLTIGVRQIDNAFNISYITMTQIIESTAMQSENVDEFDFEQLEIFKLQNDINTILKLNTYNCFGYNEFGNFAQREFDGFVKNEFDGSNTMNLKFWE